MGVVKNLMVRAGADFSSITKQANKAKASMSGMQTSVSKSCSKMTAAVSGLNKVMGLLGVGLSVTAIVALAKSAKEAYDEQTEASAKLTQVMKNTMSARADEIKSIEDLIDAQERLGVVKGDVQTEAAQELGTYLTLSSSLKTLIPVLNDMVAQQYGIGASAESAVSIATMMGKVMNGQTSALSRYGYTFTEAQEAILKYGTEAQRAATLAEVVEESVGGMNAALAATPNGRLQQVSNTLGKIKENFGQAVSNIAVLFIPALNTVCNILASLATLANKVAQTLANVFGGGASSAATAVSYTGAATSAMEDLTDSTEAAGAAASKLGTAGFDTLQKLSGTSSGSGAADTAGTDIGSVGGITETAAGADEAGESIGWLEQRLATLKEKFSIIDTSNLEASLDRLKEAAAPLTEGLFSGLSWAMDNILVPLASWTIEDALPAFLDMLADSASALSPALDALGSAAQPLVQDVFSGIKWAYDNIFIPFGTWVGSELAPAFLNVLAEAAGVLSTTLDVLKPLGLWLWESFLEPIATWTGGVIVDILNGLAEALGKVGDWISNNKELVQGMTVIVAAFFAAWELTSLMEFIINAGSLPGIIAKVTSALAACTVAKIADKVATAEICALYIKDWAVALASNVAAIAKDVAAWIALRAEWIAAKASLVAATVAQAAHTAAEWAGTAATTALGVAMNVLCSPITLVIAAIAALVAGIVLLVKNWDTVKEVASKVWAEIKKVWGEAGSWFAGVTDTVKSAWNSGMDNLKQWGSDAWASIKEVWSAAGSWFKANVTTPISDGFKGFANGIISFFEGVVNTGISGINKLIGAINKVSFDVPDWVPVIGGKTFGFSLREVSKVSLPRLATGAVIPPNNEFAAILGDQTSGMNIETPENLLREIFREELSMSRLLDILDDILDAIMSGKTLKMGNDVIGKLSRKYADSYARATGN